jgi:hypothetical protein
MLMQEKQFPITDWLDVLESGDPMTDSRWHAMLKTPMR